ncbi:TIMELESS-interacting protein [Erinaceus europaeus]|uniref:TIMELESS-interacting protein n=1 Tax=Erinaceus europaeus TaxID=9365 RepID=A0ABM3W121_ERIEU|nr:TIMELESS-interacting protein [Erinaceus europaeus]XP_060030269.1 TIMELESS-interacting protein [Erinaceus europaeus]XP_060030270.1 TIMELESS-interacting protein [Erinaceus europaeus]XP_060030271.1 TIMELESS-interacting protein [Erinaceus europaeus]XP_060030272.1 TIMELESS-interacting protein [Erinaceus europaeus]
MDYEHLDLDDGPFAPLPPPASPGEAEPEAEAEPAAEARRVPVPARRAAKRSAPRLDAQRLISERGLPTLRHVFDKAKFKGKGHEAEDLKTLIRHMEHWAHRLFPKLQFEDFIDRVESLGNKKEVQTCLKRIRLDLPILHEDFVGSNDAAEDDDGHNAFTTGFDPFLTSSSEAERFAFEPNRSVTEEQQQRMERNKQLALERRRAKLLAPSPVPGTDSSVLTPTAAQAVSAGEAPEEMGPDGPDTDLLDSAAHEEASPPETAPLDPSL